MKSFENLFEICLKMINESKQFEKQKHLKQKFNALQKILNETMCILCNLKRLKNKRKLQTMT